MASPFDDLDADVSAAIDAEFGEVVQVRPRVSAQYVERAPHPTIMPFDVLATFSAGPTVEQVKGQVRGAELVGATRLGSMTAECWIARAMLAIMPHYPAVGDAIALISRVGAPVYAVSQTQATDMGDVNLILVREDQP